MLHGDDRTLFGRRDLKQYVISFENMEHISAWIGDPALAYISLKKIKEKKLNFEKRKLQTTLNSK